MEPIVLFPSAESLARGESGFDCDCACALPGRVAPPDHQTLPSDAFLQTCQPIYQQTLVTEFDLILSPASHTTLAVVNGPARRMLDFFNAGGTIEELIETSALPETTCRETVETLWRAGFLAQSAVDVL